MLCECDDVVIGTALKIRCKIMKNVTIYTTPTCVYCKMTKEFFQENNVEYTEKDVSTDAAARDEMIQKSGQMGVPVVDVEGEFVVGFDKEKLSSLLGIGAGGADDGAGDASPEGGSE